jgi:hypothetical protein
MTEIFGLLAAAVGAFFVFLALLCVLGIFYDMIGMGDENN